MAKRATIAAKREPATRVLTMTRLFDAPRALVYRAFADPKEALKWSGPRDYPAIHIEGDLRPGGAWRACLRGVADGRELWQGGVYKEVVPNERLVFTFAWEGEARELGPKTLVTITFADQGDKTLMPFRQGVFDTKGNRDGHRVGWTSAFDRLAALLARTRRG
jgi:uncharacterized protein YndB with AHSA1/START domain